MWMRSRLLLIILFGFSGATGLLYESIWSQYLGLFLGHSAYAQSVVLVLFMGGLSVGAYAAGRVSKKLEDPLKAYALVEALIGVSGLVFHWLYIRTTGVFFELWLPNVDLPTVIAVSQWVTSGLLIFPQTLLLGATFPLMVAGLSRRSNKSTGHATAGVYFINSLGAALGVLFTGFYLAPELGLPASLMTAGITNLIIAAVALSQSRPNPQSTALKPLTAGTAAPLYLLVAAVTGCASFMYEIGWIRMLSLVLGSSSHAFELMLSAFIFGLAVGGYVIRRRIETLQNPRRYLAYVQLAMGAFAALSVVFYDQTFLAMQFLLQALQQTDQGYFFFNLFSHALTFAFMLPVTICAGMTLPLLTKAMIEDGHGEASIGKIYSANTLGSLLGVMLAIHVIMPLFGLKALICLGALADIALGRWLIGRSSRLRRMPLAYLSLAALVWFAVAGFVRLDPIKMASGVYLHGTIKSSREILFHRDGKTASVDVIRNGDHLAIATNGKVDAAVNDITPSLDEPTMTLLAALPYAIAPETRHAAIIGFGSGITSQTLLASRYLESLDTIEIEPRMVEGARFFGDRVNRVFEDPRSRIIIDDAKTYFARRKRNYGLIISEPSNPWISGIASLFSVEYYRTIRQHLDDDGLFVQWLQIYGMNLDGVASVMKALEVSFPHYVIYALNNTNLAIIATKAAQVELPQAAVFDNEELRTALATVGITTVEDLIHRRIGSNKLLSPYFGSFAVPANSDFHGVLAPAAIKARYKQEDALGIQRFRLVPISLPGIIEGLAWPVDPERLSDNLYLRSAELARIAVAVRDWVLAGQQNTGVDSVTQGALLKLDYQECSHLDNTDVTESLQLVAAATLPYLQPADLHRIWSQLAQSTCSTLR